MENPYLKNLPITSWAEDDRPREKLMLKGRQSLSDAELIAILIGSGSRTVSAVELSKQILAAMNNDINLLAKQNLKELMRFNGIGEAKAISIMAAMELGRRRQNTEEPKVEKITSSRDAYRLFAPQLVDLPHEEFWVLLLSRSNKVIHIQAVSKGGMAGTVVDPKIIFKLALEHSAAGIIMAHNHPSGNLQPSKEDLALTKKMKEAGSLLDIVVPDHLILGNNSYYSFADEGIMH